MARKKKPETPDVSDVLANTHIADAGDIIEQRIVDTLEINYMPYAMSVILSRAIPEIDGFKPSHRKLLYTMYKMNLLSGARTKSANIVGQTMRLNPHGDASIYETMVRLARGNETLLCPFVDSKGNFGKAYSRDMHYAAPRYTEAKLEPVCGELFGEIDKDTVDFVDNYDSTMKEPVLLPVTFPTILSNVSLGIAVGMASSICSFNLNELCDTTVALIQDQSHHVIDTLPAPDFIGGGTILYDRAQMEEIYRTGRGSIKVRANYTYDKSANCIDVTEIPPTTTAEAIIDKIIERIKAGTFKEISDIRDETDKKGLKITIDLKRGTDPDKLMQKLYKSTPLEDAFSCNFNVLIDGSPRVLGVRDLLLEWIRFRGRCVFRRISFDLQKAQDKLHLLKGLEKILLDIDKAIAIIRKTEEESEVVPNLMIGFSIDRTQAEYVAEIKLRHLNREYILKRLKDIEQLEADIAKMKDTLSSKAKLRRVIIDELRAVAKKYGQARKSKLLYLSEIDDAEEEQQVPDYAVNVFHERRLLQKDHAVVAAHERRTKAQGRRRDHSFAGNDQRQRTAVFHRPHAGLQGKTQRFSRYKGQCARRLCAVQAQHGRWRDHCFLRRHGRVLSGLHAVLLSERQDCEGQPQFLRDQGEPQKADQGLLRQIAPRRDHADQGRHRRRD